MLLYPSDFPARILGVTRILSGNTTESDRGDGILVLDQNQSSTHPEGIQELALYPPLGRPLLELFVSQEFVRPLSNSAPRESLNCRRTPESRKATKRSIRPDIGSKSALLNNPDSPCGARAKIRLIYKEAQCTHPIVLKHQRCQVGVCATGPCQNPVDFAGWEIVKRVSSNCN